MIDQARVRDNQESQKHISSFSNRRRYSHGLQRNMFGVTYKANQVINLEGNSCIDIYKIPRAWDVTSFVAAILKETLGEGMDGVETKWG